MSPPMGGGRVADRLLEQLSDWGLRHVFVVPGMQVDPLVKALARHPRLRPVMASHELAAGYMADGYARASGGIGATFAIGGPGAANLVGAAITAKADRSPVLFVTGNIPAAAQGRGEFQDAGTQGSNDGAVFRAALGASENCLQGDDFPSALQALDSRLALRQPAHLLLPMDVQLARSEARFCPTMAEAPAGTDLAQAQDLLRDALHRDACVLLVMGEEALAHAGDISRIAADLGLAVATDAGTRGLLDETSVHAVGHLGFMPHPRALAAVAGDAGLRAERVFVAGGSHHLLASLRRRHPQVQSLDVDGLVACLCGASESADGEGLRPRRRDWLARLAGIQRPVANHGDVPLSYGDVVDALAARLPDDAACVVDAGQVRRIAVARWRCRQPRTLFVAEGMAPMGWSLGAAIGVQLAQPRRRVVALLGDGAMRMHGIEIGTAARYRLPILYVLLDNGAYGTVLARMQGEAEVDTALLPAADWCAFARSLGVPAVAVDTRDALERALAEDPSQEAPRLIVARVPAIEPAAYGEATGIDWGLDSSPEALDT